MDKKGEDEMETGLYGSLCSLYGTSYIIDWVLPPLSNNWIIVLIWLYMALNRTPNIDCYWVEAVPKL